MPARDRRVSWTDKSACLRLPLDWFFPVGGTFTKKARAVCAGCPVRLDCLECTLNEEADGERYGLRGGLLPSERAVLWTETMALYGR